MIEIKELLYRFEKILGHEVVKIGLVQNTIKNLTNINLKKEDIKVKGLVLVLNTKPIYKNEVLLKKDLIIKTLEEEGLKINEIR